MKKSKKKAPEGMETKKQKAKEKKMGFKDYTPLAERKLSKRTKAALKFAK